MFGLKPLLGLEPMAPIRPQLLVSHANHSATETSMYVCMYVCMYVFIVLFTFDIPLTILKIQIIIEFFNFKFTIIKNNRMIKRIPSSSI